MHDTGYDPSNEMHMILYGPSESSSSEKHDAASGHVFEKLEEMLDKKFEPLHTNMSMLEEKFSAMHIDAQTNFASMRADFKNEMQHMYGKIGALESRLEIQESNVDNVMTTITKLDASYQSRFQDYETAILDIKEVLSENMPSNFDHISGNASKIAMLEDQISKMKASGHDQHSKTMVVGGIGEDVDADGAEKWVREQMQRYSKSVATEVFVKGDYQGMLFCKFDSQKSRDAYVASL